MTQDLDIHDTDRDRRLLALFALVRNRSGLKLPIDARVDEPALIAFLPDAKRNAARDMFVRDLRDAVAAHTGRPATIRASFVRDRVTYHVHADAPRGEGAAGGGRWWGLCL